MGRYSKTSAAASEVYPCTVSGCSYSAVTKTYLQQHLRRVHFGKLYKCRSCDYETRVINNLKYHEVRHSGKKPETCHLCSKKFTHTAALRVHIGRKHPEQLTDRNMLKCNQCNFQSVLPSLLRQHMFKHRCEQSDHYCPTCDKYFVCNSLLKVHSQSRKHLRKLQAPSSKTIKLEVEQSEPESEQPEPEIPPCTPDPIPLKAMKATSQYITKRHSKLQRRLRKNKPLNGTAFKCRFCPWTTDDFWDILKHLRSLTIIIT